MDEYRSEVEHFAALLSELHDRASRIWRLYLENGPGRVPDVLYDNVDSAARLLNVQLGIDPLRRMIDQMDLDVSQLERTIGDTVEFARRCAATPIGLSFISGEAGLIPRRDQHLAFEASLEQLEHRVKLLRQRSA